MAEIAFANTFIRTISSQAVAYPDDYAQPPSNSLKRVPVVAVPVPPVPQPQKAGESSSTFEVTLKSVKPAKTVAVSVAGTDTVADLKAKWPEATSELKLLLKGKALQDAKLLREYSLKEGDTVNVMSKPPSAVPPAIATVTPATPVEEKKPGLPTLNIDAAARKGRHGRIPSVVLSPSPSQADENWPGGGLTPEGSPRNILLDLEHDNNNLSERDVSSYHSTIAKPELWEKLLGFLHTEFASPDDATLAFENFLRAAKGVLTASEVAKIRDQVGVMGMAGI
ncbi:hypothetical protein CYLTODRAFT_422546 [Cylindrobasidium torrendii FP15055 ss-10]|uniref:Ubiquitin-like domain-containing protein n=1 Tax=Cylindrobasidium torrendii FP15055 ss-10 TaxID=1314674 RepID=A0A0D7BB15_9AGAR|nr:hypothetical protein CYLTODRAFT_422546 [Cylindrobasidium torrendii FP15055 ss-10]